MTLYMTPLAPHADQAVRHAVDAYIDGRLQPMFEGDASFETRNSRYRVLDGVLFSAPDSSLHGAELVGWLLEYAGRSEVSATWKSGARAVLVDTRNDGIKGPHIIVTSATRDFRADRTVAAPAARPPTLPPSPPSGSPWAQGGSSVAQSWDRLPELPAIPPAPISPSWGLPPERLAAWPPALPPPPHPPAQMPAAPVAVLPPSMFPPPPMLVKSATLPPPPPPRPLPRALPPLPLPPPTSHDASVARRIAAAVEATLGSHDLDDGLPTVRDEKPRSTSRLSRGASTTGRAYMPPPASVPFLLSRSHQRGMPLR